MDVVATEVGAVTADVDSADESGWKSGCAIGVDMDALAELVDAIGNGSGSVAFTSAGRAIDTDADVTVTGEI